jgi:hypothetical protein
MSGSEHLTQGDILRETDYRMIIRCLLRLRDLTLAPLPRPLLILLELYGIDPNGVMTAADRDALKYVTPPP